MAEQDFESFLQDNAPQPGTPDGAPVLPAQPSAPAATTDPFEGFLREQKAAQDSATTQQAQGIVVANSTASADTAGRAAAVSRQINAPQAAVETDLPRYEAQAKAQSNAQILGGNPKLANWVAQNPDSARVANDDLGALNDIDTLASQQLWGAAKPILMGLVRGAASSFNSAALALNRGISQGIANQTGYQPTPAEAQSDWWYKNTIEPAVQNRASLATPADAPFGVKAADAVGNMLGTLAQIMGVGGVVEAGAALEAVPTAVRAVGEAVTHGTRAMAFPSLTSALNTGKDVYDQTGDMGQAILASQMSYLTSTLGGIVPIGAEGGLATRLLSGFVSGAASGEVSRQAMNLVMPQQQGFDPEQTILSGLSGAMLSGVMGRSSLHDAVRQAYSDALSAETAERGGAAVQQIGELSASSKLREHDPEAFRQYVQQVTEDSPIANVYVDGETFANALHQSAVDPNQIPGLQSRLDEAVQTGGDVQIPIEDYATHIAGTDLDKAILPELKTEEGGMTYAEGQKFYQDTATEMQTRAQELAQSQEPQTQQDQDIRKIGDTLFDQMKATGRYPDDVAKASLAPVTEFYRTMSERLGMTPGEMFDRYPLRISDGGATGPTTDTTDAAGKGDSPVRASGNSLSQNSPAVAKLHGEEIAPKESDIKSLRSAAGDYYAKTLAGTTVHNDAIGDVEFTKRGMKKMLGSSANPDKLRLLAAIPDVIRNGEYLGSVENQDAKQRNDIPRFHYFEAPVDLDGKVLRVRVNVEEHRDGKLYYNHTLPGNEFFQEGVGDQGEPVTNPAAAQEVGRDAPQGRPVTGHRAPPLPESVAHQPDNLNLRILEQEARGAFNPDANTIALLKDADLSTFLHESGHFFLSTLGDMAARPDAPQQMRDDMQTFLNWAGGKDLADWQSRTLEQQRDMHEKFARGFETYLMEGKAPTTELQPLFARFRSWLVNVYRNITGLGAELSPEVREVFDRLLASDDAIKNAERVRGYAPLDLSATEATDKQKADYASLGDKATQDAVGDMQSKSIRDMKWASNAKSKALKALQREAADARRAIQDEVTKEVADTSLERARTFLRKGEMNVNGEDIKVDKGFRLNTEALKEMYPDGSLDRPTLENLKGLTGKDGLHPDQVAEIFGFGSGDQLVRNLTDGEPVKDQIARLTDERMLQRHGELTDPDAIEAAANEAVHNEARARFMATGLKLLAKSPVPVRDLTKAATEAAETAIAAKRVRDVNPRQYEVAEAKSNREAIEQAPKDPAAAVRAQRQALLSNRLAKAAQDSVAEIKKIVSGQARYDKASIRAKMDPDILEQIDALRERFDFRQNPPGGPTKEQVALQTWVDTQKAFGYAPLQHPAMMDPSVRMHYKDMTVEQLRGFNDTIRSMEQIARERKSITVAGKKVDLAEAVGELVDKMKARGEKFTAQELVDKPRVGVDPFFKVALDRMSSFLRAASAELKPQQFKANLFDQHEILGPFAKTIFDRVFNANYSKIDMLKTLSDEFRAGAERFGKDWQKSLNELVPNDKLLDADLTKEAGEAVYRRLTRGDMLGIARHVGNESNFDKLTKGMGWEPRDVWSFLEQNMNENDWKATQLTWDSFEKHWPAMVEMNRRLGNTSPDRIEPRPFRTASGIEMKGGYAPVDYDSLRSKLAVKKSDASAINPSEGLFGKGYFRADTTTNGSLNSRVANYYDRLDLDFHSVERRLHDTIHDLAYREALLDAHKVLSDPEFRRQFQLSYGPEQYRSMQQWIGDLANGQNSDAQLSRLGQIMQSTRHMVVANGIALRVSTMIKHGGSAAFKSAGYFGGGGEKYFAARAAAIATDHAGQIEGAKEKFSEIRARAMQQDRDYRQTTSSLFKPESFQSKSERFGHAAVAYLDLMSAVPTAWGAYDRAITEGLPVNRGGTGKPMSEEDAVEYANQIVREAHGSNIESARSMILQSKSEMTKMFTMMYGFMNNSLGQALDMADKFRTAGFSKPEVLARFMMAMIVPALAAGVVEKQHKDEGWATWAAKAITGEVAGMVPLVRDAWSALKGYNSAGMAPLMQTLSAGAKPFRDAWQAAHGEAPKSPIRDLGNAIGLMIPGAGQIGTSLQYAADMHSGRQNPKNVVDVARGFALGQGNQ